PSCSIAALRASVAAAIETTLDPGPGDIELAPQPAYDRPQHTPGEEEPMEDYELQEIEFWRKLEEESMSRSAMLRRSAAAAAGLTVMSSPAAAWAARVGGEEAMTADGIPL